MDSFEELKQLIDEEIKKLTDIVLASETELLNKVQEAKNNQIVSSLKALDVRLAKIEQELFSDKEEGKN